MRRDWLSSRRAKRGGINRAAPYNSTKLDRSRTESRPQFFSCFKNLGSPKEGIPCSPHRFSGRFPHPRDPITTHRFERATHSASLFDRVNHLLRLKRMRCLFLLYGRPVASDGGGNVEVRRSTGTYHGDDLGQVSAMRRQGQHEGHDRKR